RLELGQQVATEPVLAQCVIGKLASTFKQRRPARSLELKIDERMQPVAAEPQYLEHVLRNLLTNADKYSPPDSPIEIEASMRGEEALRTAEEQRPDIVLLDIVMPEMTGLEVMRKLREQSSAPIILVTAKDTDSDKVRGLELGADDYIVKPFSPDELGARIRAVL